MGTLSRMILHLRKNKISLLDANDLVSSEISKKKLNNKKINLINGLAKTTGLKELNLIQYESKTAGKQILSLADLINSIADNSSLELLDLSHNALTCDISLALIKVITAQCVPLKHLSLSYLLNCDPNDLDNIIIALQGNTSLLTLNLYGNELSSSTCQELATLLSCQYTVLSKLNLSRCVIASADLMKIKEACLHKNNKFSLITDHILLSDSYASSPNTLKESSSLKVIEALSKPIAPSKSIYGSWSEEVLTSSNSNSIFFTTVKEVPAIMAKESLSTPDQENNKQNNYPFSLSYQ